MKCKLSEKCEFGNLCKDATRHDSLTVLGCSSFKTKEPMTNEQWLHTATTEQLADVLAKQKCDGCNDEPYDEEYGVCKYCMAKKMEQVREWLKQPHPTKE